MSRQIDHATTLPHKRVRFEPKASPNPSMSNQTAASGQTSDSDSELSESSEEPSSESSSEDETEGEDNGNTMSDARQKRHQANKGVINLRAGQGQKPIMKLDKNELGPDIRIFLKDFLPQLKAANDELAAQRRAGTLKHREIDMTDVDDNEQYIEMDLGLGVLEEKESNGASSTGMDSDHDMEDAETEKDVLGKLMGRTGSTDAVVIQEVQDTQQAS